MEASVTKQAIVEHFKELDAEDKLDLLYRLWDEISEDLQTRPATDAEKRFLEQRLRDIESDPRGARSWDAVRDDLLTD
jgi:putative addiction module component (TIGR02574 family)